MKLGFTARLAAGNLKKNRAVYFPHILTGCGLTAVYLILLTLAGDKRLRAVRGGRYLPDIMRLGLMVMTLLSLILLVYTSRFLMKQRRQEFGLYSVLGLEKRHIGQVLLFETLYSAGISMLSGLALGLVLYKLCALLICRILRVDSVLGFDYVRLSPLLEVLLLFGALYLLNFLLDLFRIERMKPVELLHSTQTGEREPRVLWPVLLLGLVSLGGGYAISLTTRNPLTAINRFFPAVVLVILGTYCLFLSGTIALLKLLRNRKNYYYRKRHMTAVSGLLFRMRQNAVGLASIAILATSVLVMVSTTVCLYAGIDQTLTRQFTFPMHFSFSYEEEAGDPYVPVPFEVQKEAALDAAKSSGISLSLLEQITYLASTYLNRKGALQAVDQAEEGSRTIPDGLCTVFFLTAADYNRLSGGQLSLSPGECALYAMPGNHNDLPEDFTLAGEAFHVAERLSVYPVDTGEYSAADVYGLVIDSEETFEAIDRNQRQVYGENASAPTRQTYIDFDDMKQAEAQYLPFWLGLQERVQQYIFGQPKNTGAFGSAMNSIWEAEEALYGLNGTLLFLGLILTLVFLFATALIMYYKQISEGMEDRERFQILQNVGMDQREIRQSIRSQILLIFFLPLLAAAVHICAAFPLLTKLLRILLNVDNRLFLLCTAGAFAAFAGIYLLLYLAASRAYEKMVR